MEDMLLRAPSQLFIAETMRMTCVHPITRYPLHPFATLFTKVLWNQIPDFGPVHFYLSSYLRSNRMHKHSGVFAADCRSAFVSPVVLSPLMLNRAEQRRTRAAASLSCQSSDWDQAYYSDWENRPLRQKYHPKGLKRPHSYDQVHTFVFISPILLCFVSFATKQLVSGEIKAPDIARGQRIDIVNRSALCCSESCELRRTLRCWCFWPF